MGSNIRRHHRAPLRAPVRVTWTDRSGTPKFAIARTLDISEMGMCVELPEAPVIRGSIGIQADRLGLACSGTIRNCNRCGGKYLVGVEFTNKVRLKGEAADAVNGLVQPDPYRDRIEPRSL